MKQKLGREIHEDGLRGTKSGHIVTVVSCHVCSSALLLSLTLQEELVKSCSLFSAMLKGLSDVVHAGERWQRGDHFSL